MVVKLPAAPELSGRDRVMRLPADKREIGVFHAFDEQTRDIVSCAVMIAVRQSVRIAEMSAGQSERRRRFVHLRDKSVDSAECTGERKRRVVCTLKQKRVKQLTNG